MWRHMAISVGKLFFEDQTFALWNNTRNAEYSCVSSLKPHSFKDASGKEIFLRLEVPLGLSMRLRLFGVFRVRVQVPENRLSR